MLRVAPLVIAYATWFIFILAWNLFDKPATTIAVAGERRERLHSLVLALAIVMLVVAPVTLKAGRNWVNPPGLDWAMLLVMAAAIAWCWWARRHLGPLWSAAVTRKEGQRVVDTGAYRFVRHPIYTGFIVIYIAMAVISTTVMALAAAAVMALGLWLKARVEEQFLIEELGASTYGAYQARTPMLVPGMRRARGAE